MLTGRALVAARVVFGVYLVALALIVFLPADDARPMTGVVAIVADLIGPSVVAWGSHFFCKMPRDGKAVSWHQDASYWPLTPSKAVTVWLAIDDADRGNACMRFLPGTHTLGHLTYKLSETDEANVLNQTVPDIVRKVLEKYPFPVDFRLSRDYRSWEYCVQYQETDFNFMSRLLENEGIYYFFEHSSGSHKLVLADHIGAHSPLPGYAKIPHLPADKMTVPDEEYIDFLQMVQEMEPGEVALRDFDFKRPKANLNALAIDAMPYVCRAGPALVAAHFAEAARVLRAGGDLVILNFSYRGDLERDRQDVRAAAGAAGLCVLRDGTSDLRLWDGATFHLRKV